MPSISERIKIFLASPRGQRLIERGRRELAKPSTQQRLRRLAARLHGDADPPGSGDRVHTRAALAGGGHIDRMRLRAYRRPPEGCRRAGGISLRGNRRLPLWLNLLAIPWLFACVVGYGLLAALVRRSAPSWSGQVSLTPLSAVLLLGAVAAGLVLVAAGHEAVHGLAFWLFTGSRPVFGVGRWYAYTSAPGWYLRRAQFLTVLLAPLFVFTAAGLPLLAIGGPRVAAATLAALVVNAAAAIGDLYLCLRVGALPRTAVVEDQRDGVSWYLPPPSHS